MGGKRFLSTLGENILCFCRRNLLLLGGRGWSSVGRVGAQLGARRELTSGCLLNDSGARLHGQRPAQSCRASPSAGPGPAVGSSWRSPFQHPKHVIFDPVVCKRSWMWGWRRTWTPALPSRRSETVGRSRMAPAFLGPHQPPSLAPGATAGTSSIGRHRGAGTSEWGTAGLRVGQAFHPLGIQVTSASLRTWAGVLGEKEGKMPGSTPQLLTQAWCVG